MPDDPTPPATPVQPAPVTPPVAQPPAPPALPAPPAPPAPTAPPAQGDDVRPPPGMTEWSYRELKETRTAAQEAVRLAKEANARAERAEQQLADERTDRELAEANPELRDPDLRKAVREAFAKRADQAMRPGAWLQSDEVKGNKVLSRLLAPSTPPQTLNTPTSQHARPPARKPTPAPNPGEGSHGTPSGPAGRMSDDQIGAIAEDPTGFKANRGAIKAQLEQDFGRSIGSSPTASPKA